MQDIVAAADGNCGGILRGAVAVTDVDARHEVISVIHQNRLAHRPEAVVQRNAEVLKSTRFVVETVDVHAEHFSAELPLKLRRVEVKRVAMHEKRTVADRHTRFGG